MACMPSILSIKLELCKCEKKIELKLLFCALICGGFAIEQPYICRFGIPTNRAAQVATDHPSPGHLIGKIARKRSTFAFWKVIPQATQITIAPL